MKPRVPLPPQLTNAPFSVGTAMDAGIGFERLRGHDLARPFRGVRSTSAPQSLIDLCRAYATVMPPDAYFSCITAALLRGAPLPLAVERSRTLHVARPSPADPLAARGIRGHSFAPIVGGVRLVRGLRVSSPASTWCELASEISLPDLVAVGDFYIFREAPMCSVADLSEAVLRSSGRRGIRNMRAALALLDDNVRSRQESLLRVFLVLSGFTGFVTNFPVTVFGRKHVIDIAFPAVMVALEYDGDYHRDRNEWRKTMTRRARLEAAGWRVMQINADDLADPTELAERLAAFLSANWA